jgi:hypothetical protein
VYSCWLFERLPNLMLSVTASMTNAADIKGKPIRAIKL